MIAWFLVFIICGAKDCQAVKVAEFVSPKACEIERDAKAADKPGNGVLDDMVWLCMRHKREE